MDLLKKGVWTVFLPALPLHLAAVGGDPWWLAAGIALCFVLLRLVKAFRARKNLWMFLMVSFSTVSLNLCLLNREEVVFLFRNESAIVTLLYSVILYFALFSLEQAAMGMLTRLLWRYQAPSLLNVRSEKRGKEEKIPSRAEAERRTGEW